MPRLGAAGHRGDIRRHVLERQRLPCRGEPNALGEEGDVLGELFGLPLTWRHDQDRLLELLEQAGTTPPGAEGVVFLPYLAGERSPIWDPKATGAFVGLTLGHGRGHLTRAILEASALAIRHVAEPMLAAGVRVSAMRACGGPARSETWNQIKADVTGFPVLVPAVLETAVLGSAILGAVAIEASTDVPSAVRSMTRIERRLDPRPETRDVYDRAYDVYAGLYPALRPLLQGGTA